MTDNNSFEKGGIVGYFKSYLVPPKKTTTTTDDNNNNLIDTPILQTEELTDNKTTTTTTNTTTSSTPKTPEEEKRERLKREHQEQYEQLKRLEEDAKRRLHTILVAKAVPEVIDHNIDRSQYSKVLLGDLHTTNPDEALWLAGALSGGAGFLVANSFMKTNPIRGLRVFTIFTASALSGYYGSKFYYDSRKSEIEYYRENSLDIKEEQNFIAEAAKEKMYQTILDNNIKKLDKEIEKANNLSK